MPDLIWCEFPTSDRGPLEEFTGKVKEQFPDAKFAFNYSSSFKWYNDENPLTFDQLGAMDIKFLFITLGGQHATGHGFSVLLQDMLKGKQQGYIDLQKKEWAEGTDFPTRSHHFFSGVPLHHIVGDMFESSRLGTQFVEKLGDDKVV